MKIAKTKLSENQTGFASLVIAIVLVLVLSLLTVGFAELMRKEERSALDRHLSSQAFFAAESGVNDAAKVINSGLELQKTDCGPLQPTHPAYADTRSDPLKRNKVGSQENIEWTCLTIDPYPKELEYGFIDTDQAKAVLITGVDPSNPANPVAIGSLVIGWQDSNNRSQTFASSFPEFPPVSGWGSTVTVLRISLTPLGTGTNLLSRPALINNTYTAFLYPNGSGSPTAEYPYNDSRGYDSGAILRGNCHTSKTPRDCNVRITGLSQANYLLTMRSLPYASKARVTIKAYDLNGAPLNIRNAQTVVDSTGKAQDVLRRVQARIPSRNTYPGSDFALDVMNGICKQLELTPSSGSNNCAPVSELSR